MKSLLPVPAKPLTCQLSSTIVAWLRGDIDKAHFRQPADEPPLAVVEHKAAPASHEQS